MKNRVLLLVTLILIQFATLAQTIELDPPEIFPAAPSASELGKFGSYPVNLSTGLPQIEIPLYTVQSGYFSDTDHSFQMKLSSVPLNFY